VIKVDEKNEEETSEGGEIDMMNSILDDSEAQIS